jgi:hypothetical protein
MSETFRVRSFECSYVGNLPLAKSYGMQSVYHVRWLRPADSMRRFIDTLIERVTADLRELAVKSLDEQEQMRNITHEWQSRRLSITGLESSKQ